MGCVLLVLVWMSRGLDRGLFYSEVCCGEQDEADVVESV